MAKRKPDEEAYIRFRNRNIPVKIYFEDRRNTRISIGTTSIHLRLPDQLTQAEFEDQIRWADRWLQKHLSKSPGLIKRFDIPQFSNGDRIRVLNDTYILHLNLVDGNNAGSASLDGHDLFIRISKQMDHENRNKSIQTLIHKILCERYVSFIKKRVATINAKYFRQKYKRVQLKYIHSKWGSCSHDGDIIISSKLLLCPEWIRDYVIVHELAHLIEHNHSDAFWSLVEQVLPEYSKADEWLNNEGAGIEIYPLPSSSWPSYQRMKRLESATPGEESTNEGDNTEADLTQSAKSEPTKGTQLSLF